MLENNVRIIKHKVGLLNLAEELGNVSRACKAVRRIRASNPPQLRLAVIGVVR